MLVNKYTKKELNKLSIEELKGVVHPLMMAYYPNSGICFPNGDIKKAVNTLLSQAKNKNTLIKDILSIQKKIK